MQLSIFIFIYFTHLGHISTLDLTSVKGSYLEYVITIIQHICGQKGWDSMKHLQLNHDEYENMTIKDAFTQKINKNNILDMFIIVVRLHNYKYSQILRNYAELITLNIKECEKYLTDNLFRGFIDSTRRIENEVKKSLKMFKKLYEVMTFISYIDIKFLFTNILQNPYVMVDEIYFAYHYTNTMKISDQSFYTDQVGNIKHENAISVLLNIKTFINQLYLMAQSVEKKRCVFAQLPEKINYHLIFEERYLHYNLVDDNPTAIDILLNMLDTFCKDTIKNDYEDLGFKEILNPILYKCDSLLVPQFDSISQNKGIVNLNILLNDGNWETLHYLYITYNKQALSVNRVLRDQVNNNNYHLKKQYITLLLRCRFYDILKNFITRLSGVIHFCKQEKKFENLKKFNECVNNFFLTMKSVQNFLHYLDIAMEKLKQATIWHDNGAFYCISPIKKIVNNVLDLMKQKNLLRDVFSDGILDLYEVANNYLNDVEDVKFSIQLDIKNASRVHNRHCSYHKKVLFSKQDVLNSIMTNAISTNITHLPTNPISYCQQACVDLYMYCEDFISNEYKNLGFDKIN
ncbi:uncharacterized protein LOC126900231 [Daktulosphaira vitifoliae]|uniref:uncharacterized protein LOC126900231 n=1 Tax=Daktulosphaira vitifoliae TaxID=58002 RepID=UPI0021AA04B5|nr:uncharacterized protein LOC126900231 [Daktulosphaira vitifoliae]